MGSANRPCVFVTAERTAAQEPGVAAHKQIAAAPVAAVVAVVVFAPAAPVAAVVNIAARLVPEWSPSLPQFSRHSFCRIPHRVSVYNHRLNRRFPAFARVQLSPKPPKARLDRSLYRISCRRSGRLRSVYKILPLK